MADTLFGNVASVFWGEEDAVSETALPAASPPENASPYAAMYEASPDRFSEGGLPIMQEPTGTAYNLPKGREWQAFDGATPEPEPEGPGYLKNTAWGLASKAGDLGAGFTRVVADVASYLQDPVAAAKDSDYVSTIGDSIRGFADVVDQIGSESYQPKYPDFEAGLNKAAEGDFGYLAGFMAEQLPNVALDIAAAVYAAPVYVVALTGIFAYDRAERDGKSVPDAKDYGYAASAAVVAMTLDRIAASGVKGALGKEALDRIGNVGADTITGRILAGAARGTLSEGVSGAQEEFMVSYDTKSGVDTKAVIMNGLAEAFLGAGVGAGIGAISGPPKVGGAVSAEAVPADLTAAIQTQAPAAVEPPVPGGATPEASQPEIVPPIQSGLPEPQTQALETQQPEPGAEQVTPSDPGAVSAPASESFAEEDLDAAWEAIQTGDVENELDPTRDPIGALGARIIANGGALTRESLPAFVKQVDAAVVNYGTPEYRDQFDAEMSRLFDVWSYRTGDFGSNVPDQAGLLEAAPIGRNVQRRYPDYDPGTAAGQVVGALRPAGLPTPETIFPDGRLAKDGMAGTLTALSDYARSVAGKIKVLRPDGGAPATEFAKAREAAAMRDRVFSAATRFAQGAAAVRDYAAESESSPAASEIANLLLSLKKDLQLMRGAGLDATDLVDLAGGKDAATLLRRMASVEAEARENTPKKLPDFPLADTKSREDLDRERKAPPREEIARTATASDQLYDPDTGRKRRDLSSDEVSRITSEIAAEAEEKKRAAYGEVADFETDSEVASDAELRAESRKAFSRARRGRMGDAAVTDQQDESFIRAAGKVISESVEIKRKAPKSRQFSEKVVLAYAQDNNKYVDEVTEAMQAGDLEPEMLAGLIATEKGLKKKAAAADAKQSAAAKAPPRLQIPAKTNTGRQIKAAAALKKLMKSASAEVTQALEMAQALAVAIVKARESQYFYGGAWVRFHNKAGEPKLEFVRGVRAGLKADGDLKNPERHVPQVDPATGRLYFTPEQLERGPAPVLLEVGKDEKTKRIFEERSKLPDANARTISPTNYDQLLRFVANATPVLDPLATTDVLLSSAVNASNRGKGTAGYRGPSQGKATTIEISEAVVDSAAPALEPDKPEPGVVDPDTLPPDVEFTGGDTVSPSDMPVAAFGLTDAGDGQLNVEELIALLERMNIAPKDTEQETVQEISATVRRIASLQARIDATQAMQGAVTELIENGVTEPATENDQLAFLDNNDANDRLGLTKKVNTPMGVLFVATVDGDSGTYFAPSNTDEDGNVELVADDGPQDEVFNRLLRKEFDYALQDLKDQLELYKQELKDATREATPRAKAKPPAGPAGEGEAPDAPGDAAPPAGPAWDAPKPVNVRVSAREIAPERKFVDLYRSVSGREPLDPGVDLGNYAVGIPGVVRALYDYQLEGVKTILHTYKARQQVIKARGRASVGRAGVGIFDGAGTGKSTQIAVAAAEIAKMTKKPILIFVPVQKETAGGVKASSYAQNIISDGAAAGVDVSGDQFVFMAYNYLQTPSLFKNRQFAAVFFDEAHNIKGSTDGKSWAPAAAEIDADLRVFATATPTDMAGQELYYLSYMLPDTAPTDSLASAQTFIQRSLGLYRGADGKFADPMDDKSSASKYISGLDALFTPAIRARQVVSRALPALARNSVEVLPNSQLDQDAVELLRGPLGMVHGARLSEHAKIPGLVEQTLKEIESQTGNQVLVVFSTSSDTQSGDARQLGRYAKSPFDAFVSALRHEMLERGKSAPIVQFKGGQTNETDLKKFQTGQARVFVGVDVAMATGLNLDDNPEGTRAKYKLDYTPQSRPRVTLVAGTQRIGEIWTQLAGRTDRSATKTIPYIKFLTFDNNPHDLSLRQKLRQKVQLQEAVTRAGAARDKGVLKDVNPTMMNVRSTKGTPLFRPLGKNGRTPAQQRLIDHIDNTQRSRANAASVLDNISKTDEDPRIRAFAASLTRLAARLDTKVEVTDFTQWDEQYHGNAGLYDPVADKVWVDENAGALGVTVLHEVVHALTYKRMQSDPGLVRQVEQLIAALPAGIRAKYGYETSSVFEFVAEAFAEPGFQAALRASPFAGKKSLWDRFKEIVRNMLRSRGVTTGPSVFDKLMELNVFADQSPDAAPNAEAPGGDANHAPLFRKVPQPTRPLAPSVREKLAAAVGRIMAPGGRGTGPAATLERALLATMTYEQIVSAKKGLTQVALATGDENYMDQLLRLQEGKQAASQKIGADYQAKIVDPLRAYAQGAGARMIKAVLEPGTGVESVTEFEFLSHAMNMSGYGQAHFGKDLTDQINSVVNSTKKANQVSEQTAIWDLYKPQFDRVSAEGQKIYNDIAEYFKTQANARGVTLAGLWLDANFPLGDGVSWVDRPETEIREKVKETGNLSEEDLKGLEISRSALKEAENILKPGRVPGAYFPLQRFGNYVVTTEGEVTWGSDAERDELVSRYFGGKVDEEKKTIKYKAVSRFESSAEAQAYSDAMRQRFVDLDVSGVQLASELMLAQRPDINSDMLISFKQKLDKNENLDPEVKEAALRQFTQAMLEMTPQTSIAGKLLPRARVLGASTDIMRALANYGAGNSHYLAGLRFAKKLNDVRGKLRGLTRQKQRSPSDRERGEGNQLNMILAEFNKRDAFMADPFEMTAAWQTANDVGFAYYLVGASYNIVNLTQVPLFTMPFLSGRFGGVRATAALISAYRAAGRAPMLKMLKTGGSLTELRQLLARSGTTADFDKDNYKILDQIVSNVQDPNHKKLLERMAGMGDIDATLAMDFSRTAQRSHVDAQGRPRAQSKWEYLTEWMKMGPHIIEVMNRSVTAIAAFDLQYARELKKGATKEAAFEAGMEYARTAIKRTQFIYANWNKPRIMQGQALRTIMMFKQHVQNTYFNMVTAFIQSSRPLTKALRGEKMTDLEKEESREARRGLATFLGVMLMANGAIGGVPEPLKWLTSLIFWATGEDDEPFDWELWVQQEMADFAGPKLGQVLSRGAPTLVGMDLSGRVGINSMLLGGNFRIDEKDSLTASIARTVGGPMFALGERFLWDLPQHIKAGRYMQAAEAATPKAIRDVIRASRINQDGFTDLSGKVYATGDNLTWWDYTQMYMGFTPLAVSQLYSQRAVLGIDQAMASQRNAFYEQYRRATTPAEKSKVVFRIKAWNERNPYYAISAKQLRASIKTTARLEAETKDGVYVRKAVRPYIDEQLRFIPQP